MGGQAEGKGHAAAAGSGDDPDAGGRVKDAIGLLRVLSVDAVPALGDGRIGEASEGGEVVEDQGIEMRLIEDVDGEAVLVGVAESDLPGSCLGNQDVDAPLVELGRLRRDASFELGQGGAEAERAVEA